jgi:putative tryptophan/tyrosine transport system substrate-binding protein
MGARRLGWVFILLVAAAAAFSAPLAYAGEPAQRVMRVGFVDPASPTTRPRGFEGFWQHLRELGWVEGQNMVIEARWADGRNDRLPALMAELVERKVDVLVTYGTSAAAAAKGATSTIPIVNAGMADPVASGLVTSLAHPGGNLTGISLAWVGGMASKRLELLQETVPHLSSIAMIANPDDPQVIREMAKELEAVAPTRGIKARLIELRDPQAFDRAFKQARKEAQALLVPGGLFMFVHRREVTALAAKYKLPAMYPLREYVDSGGLMAYGADVANLFRRAADYVDRILRGAKPGDLPIEQPTKFELVINLKTAKALGITFPESILVRADEVIK